ncbi:MAG: hypothetical protein M9886_06910 [Candidatus Nanopelagicales bacterium]|nr:hypothetical protein [Candidatus Nanopelagicales bacterium]
MAPSNVQLARNRLAALHKYHQPDHPKIVAARAALAEAKLVAEIERAPLTIEARSRLAALILGGAA